MVENWWEIKEGNPQHLYEFMDFYQEHGHSYEEFDARMDVGELCNMMILESFQNNQDFPANNIEMWRSTADGGRWRWIIKDTDCGLGLYDIPYDSEYLNWFFDNDQHPNTNWEEYTRLFRRLMDIDKFRNMFIDRAAVYMGDFLNGVSISSDMDEMVNIIRPEYQFHRALYDEGWVDYETEVSKAKEWANKRTSFFYDHLREFYGLGAPVPVTVDKERTDKVSISINDIPLSRRWFDGKYFTGRELRLNGTNEETGLPVDKWIIKTEGAEPTQTELPGASVSYTIPQGATAITITSVCDGSGVGTIEADDIDMYAPYDVYTIDGRRVSGDTSLPAGVYILKQGSKTRKIIK